MPNGKYSRRGFLAASLASLTIGAGIPVWYAREVVDRARSKRDLARKRVAPSDRIALGAIGVGGQGYRLMTEAVQKRPDVELIAACDVDAGCLRAAIAKSGLEGIVGYNDFRDLLQRRDIDAVTVATPDHWHSLIGVAAMRAGKDVYCEKPLTLTIDEGKTFTRVAGSTGRIVQVGTHQRSDPRFRLACELVRNGRIGRLGRIETRVGANPPHKPLRPSAVPGGLDWDLWLGQAPAVPYIKERCRYDFRWWYEYSGGKLTDWGVHHNDIAQWAMGTDAAGPVTIAAESTPVGIDPNAYNCPSDFKVTYTYASGVELICSAKGKNGILFTGDAGWIFVDRARIEASEPRLLDEPLSADAIRLHSSDDHIRNFLDCVKNREKPVCDAQIGHRSASVSHLGNIAIRTGESLRWDPSAERFIANTAADAMLVRPMRSPWTLDG